MKTFRKAFRKVGPKTLLPNYAFLLRLETALGVSFRSFRVKKFNNLPWDFHKAVVEGK